VLSRMATDQPFTSVNIATDGNGGFRYTIV
jgi:hypothetical protein